jgi:hypothetical protein
MKKKFTDKKAEVLADRFKKAYDKYLSESESKRSTALREDAFIHGVVAGMHISAEAGQILKEMGE